MRLRYAFTIVELVVVVLILGILAAVAAHKILRDSQYAHDRALEQSLDNFRDAVERYYADNNGFPKATGPTELTRFARTYFRAGRIPACTVGEGLPQGISIVSDGLPLAGTGNTDTKGKPMWKLDTKTGELIINYHAPSNLGTNYDDW